MPEQFQPNVAESQTVMRPLRWPLIVMPSNRSENTSKDARLVNGFMEKEPQGDTWIYKRPGFKRFAQFGGVAGLAQGCYNWLGDVYVIVNGRLYKNGVEKGSTINTTNGVYRFSSCMGSSPTPDAIAELIFGNGIRAFSYNDTAGLQDFTLNANFPHPFRKGWAYLNGTTYVMTREAEIFGSDIDDPETWEEDNKIIAYIEPSRGVALSKQLVYVIAFKESSTEVFYDQGNPTGTLLGRVQGAKVNYGCISEDSVRLLDGMLFWLCTNDSAAVQVMKMDNLKPEIISTPAIERLFEHADFTSVYSWTMKLEGHRWYVITLKNNNLTLAFDLTTGLWSQWTDVNGNYLPIVDSTYYTPTAETLLQHESDGYLYTASMSNYTDEGAPIVMDIFTSNYDAGTAREKTLKAIYFDASQDAGSILRVRHSDDDYRTWTQWREVDLNQAKVQLQNEGKFKRRAYNFQHTSPTPFRIKSADLQLDIATI